MAPSPAPLPAAPAALAAAATAALLTGFVWSWAGGGLGGPLSQEGLAPPDAAELAAALSGFDPTEAGEEAGARSDSGPSDAPGARSSGSLGSITPANPGVGGLVVPVRGVSPEDLVDTWGAPRGGGRGHEGLDIMAPRGTPVLATAPGTILRRYRSPSGGLTVYQMGPRGRLVFYYAHLERWADGVDEGDRVRAGDVIGYVGDSGNAGAGVTHLHFEVIIFADPERWWEGVSVNPYRVLTGLARDE